MSQLVHYELTDQVARITLDSSANRNALSRRLVTELFARLDQAAAADAAKVVLLGSSESVFCSGADLTEAAAGGMQQGTRTLVELQRRILALPKPVVVRLDGPVRAGGLGIVAAADIVLAEEGVSFAFTEVRLALTPAVISLTVLPRLTSRAAADTFLTGRSFGAAEAVAMGLVTRAVPALSMDTAVEQVCADLAKAPSQGLRETKALLSRPMLAHLDAHSEEMAALSARLFGSEAAAEAMTAFLDRSR
ncbi:MAG: enoyl-CoA hydratase-related protein [Actinomycetota bacterium]|nr:enoyl-CoA hydratase-related protein [Actinomycetota bacterium]MDQ6934136.1 enoyl-CoA hydratase-related protein [Actinomycetota bacterium]